MIDDPLKSEWLVENRVRLVTVKNDLKASAVHLNDREMVSLMDKLSAPMHLIVDMRELRSFPRLDEILNLQYLRHEYMGWLLTVGASRSRILRFFLNAVGRTTRVRFHDFDDLDEVIAFLEQNEPLLRGSLTA